MTRINLALGKETMHLYYFCFAPEHRVSKKELRELVLRTSELDFKIDMGITIFTIPQVKIMRIENLNQSQ